MVVRRRLSREKGQRGGKGSPLWRRRPRALALRLCKAAARRDARKTRTDRSGGARTGRGRTRGSQVARTNGGHEKASRSGSGGRS
jgi:hypothetical protein